MSKNEHGIQIRFTPQEAERLSKAALFAFSFLQEFALEENRGELEILMVFMGRLEVEAAAIAKATNGAGESRDEDDS